jgi:hypothetical protein
MDLFPIYQINYRTRFKPVNDALVSAGSPEKAKSLLEEYLMKNPLNPNYLRLSLPEERGFSCKRLEIQADKEMVIYCSR